MKVMAHSHQHSHAHGHPHSHGDAGMGRALIVSIVLTLGFVAFETVAGIRASSLALLSDAGHNFADAFALLLAAFGFYLQSRPANAVKTYGYQRAGVLAAFVNDLSNWPLWNPAVKSASGYLDAACQTASLDLAVHELPHFPVSLPTSALIINSSLPGAVRWTYGLAAGLLFGLHETAIWSDGDSSSWWQNWERADGLLVNAATSWWAAQFEFVQTQTFAGLLCLSNVYASQGGLSPAAVGAACNNSSRVV